MVATDRATRDRLVHDDAFWRGYHPAMRAVHRRNGDRLEAILNELDCWPGSDLVGTDGSEAAWLVAQHDIANPQLMRRSRDLMAVAVESEQASAVQLAHLIDRIRSFEGSTQLYGTQRGRDDSGYSSTWPPLDDPELVDQRRRAIGLGPLGSESAEREPEAAQPVRFSEDQLAEFRRREREFAESVGWR